MADENTDRGLKRAILSLLVAADQRCPAIIGQAHLLYHERSNVRPVDLVTALAQLKREADELCQAIADVGTAISESDAHRSNGTTA
jgi:hypothetical protein